MSEKQTLQEKHFALVDAVNDSRTEDHHRDAQKFLHGWRQGIEDAGIQLSYVGADFHTMERFGKHVELCAGVLLNWRPTTLFEGGERISSCCGASPRGASEDMGMCPECKEHCEYEEVEP